MTSTDAWEQALGARSGPKPRPVELPRSSEVGGHRAAEPRTRGSDKPKTGKRLDIQGLRMVAVVAVVINHLTGHPKGGFVGVDVFFVISGYLITGLLIRDLGRGTGPVRYITDFYRRRVRRLFPAALLTILLTTIVAAAAFNSGRAHATRTDGLWAAIFWANWHFIGVGTDYFTAAGPDSPFQHYWSLSVEEQFYIVWPIALFLLIALVGRAKERINLRRTVGAAAAIVVIAVSLWWAFDQTTGNPTSAYFSTFTRGWELGLGALLACVVPRFRLGAVPLTVMSWVGMAAIIVSVFVVSGSHDFPAPGALLPCLGSALVIAAVSNDGTRARNAVLTNRVSGFVGDISYSIYLVHFPVIVLLASYIPGKGGYYYAIAVALMLGLAVAMYSLVERPVLNSGWLQPKKASPDAAAAADDPIPTRILASLAALAVVTGMGIYALQPSTDNVPTAVRNRLDALAEQSTAPTAVKQPPLQAALTKQIDAALGATSWPSKLNPSVAYVTAHPSEAANPDAVEPCGAINLASRTKCTFGPANAAHTIYLVGDSTAVSYATPFIAIAKQLGDWNVRVAGGYGCVFADRELKGFGDFTPAQCLAHNRQVEAEINSTHPDLVFVTDAYITHQAASGDNLTEGDWAATLGAAVKSIAGGAGRVALLAPPPAKNTIDIRTCDTPSSTPDACITPLNGEWTTRRSTESALARSTHSVFVDSAPWFCNTTAGLCTSFVGNTLTKPDWVHLALAYGTKIAPVVLEALRQQEILS